MQLLIKLRHRWR